MEPNTVYNEDCVQGLKKIPDDTVQIIIADCPYNIGKDFQNDSDRQTLENYLSWCDEWITECLRVLKPNGTMYIYGFSEILAFIRVRMKCNVRWLVWHYTNKNVPSLQFWQRSHESILCCWKKEKVFNLDSVREPYTDTFLKNSSGKKRNATKGRFSKGDKETTYVAHEKGALPRDVIKVPALAGGAGRKERVDHPTQKPLELCRKLLCASQQNKDDLVVIPFAGSGSECVACKELGLPFVAFEINPVYVQVCLQRLNAQDTESQDTESLSTNSI
jgi:site-specific DNA-methyltransferase (adenine-specific)